MLERSDSARHEMHGAGTEGACGMQAGRGRARVVALADACGGGQGSTNLRWRSGRAGPGWAKPGEREEEPGQAV